MKNEYLQQICNKLNERGFTTYDGSDLFSTDRKPYTIDSESITELSWLPEDNLKRIAEYDGYSKAKDYRSLYQAWGREGFFKFTPYVVDCNSNTTLCVRHNKFLHMFRGYHFQLSGTPDGDGDYGSGLLRTDNFINIMRDYNYSKSHLGFIILYAAMIDCGFQNDNFRDLFYSDKKEVDEFFRNSMKYWGINVDYGYDIVNKYISYRDGSIDIDAVDRTVYCFRGKDGVWCRFWSSPKAVEVEYCYDTDSDVGKSKVVRFEIPEPVVGINTDSIKWWNEEDTEDLNMAFDTACFKYEKIEYFILLMLLKLIGINSNYMATYNIKKIGYIHDDERAITIEKFDGIQQ